MKSTDKKFFYIRKKEIRIDAYIKELIYVYTWPIHFAIQ